MKRIGLLSLVLCLALSVSAQEKGIQFFKGTFQEALAKADKEGKIVFVDAYTTWCGPCKAMSKNVFPDEAVGAFYNDKFINMKIDQEKGEGINFAKQYKVQAYPSLIFVNPDGSLAHQQLGAMEAADFIALGEVAANPRERYSAQLAKYNNGDRDPMFLKKYASTLSTAGLDGKDKVIMEYLAHFEDWKTEDNVKFIFENVPFDLDNELFMFMSQNRPLFKKIVENPDWVDAKLNYGVQIYLRGKEKVTDKDVDEAYRRVFPEGAEKMAEKAKIDQLARDPNRKAEFFDRTIAYYERFPAESWNELNSIAWTFFENTEDKRHLNVAKEWAMKSIKMEENYYNTDTYAWICYKLGDTESARIYAVKAIELGRVDGQEMQETHQLLEKLSGK